MMIKLTRNGLKSLTFFKIKWLSTYITSPSPVDEDECVKEILTRQEEAEELKKIVVP